MPIKGTNMCNLITTNKLTYPKSCSYELNCLPMIIYPRNLLSGAKQRTNRLSGDENVKFVYPMQNVLLYKLHVTCILRRWTLILAKRVVLSGIK